MNHNETHLTPGLYLVATPIGNARDITLRALDVLAAAELLVAEDTRTLLKLMQIHGIARNGRPIWAYHDHSGAGVAQKVAEQVAAGKSVAYCSDAGTPLVSDPGHGLVSAFVAADLPVVAVPGASAALSALTVAGLPSDRFVFLGFPPAKSSARRDWLKSHAHRGETMILYESPRRVAELLADVALTFGDDHPVVFCRELTKRFETVRRDGAKTLAEELEDTPPKGECVVLIAGVSAPEADIQDLDSILLNALETMSMKDAVSEVAQSLNLPRKQVYQAALALKTR